MKMTASNEFVLGAILVGWDEKCVLFFPCASDGALIQRMHRHATASGGSPNS